MEIIRRLSGVPGSSSGDRERNSQGYGPTNDSLNTLAASLKGAALEELNIPLDELLADCEAFTEQVKREVFGPPRRFSLFSSPEAPRGDLTQTYEKLMGKVEDAEKKLRTRVWELTEKKSALRDQALHLKERVDSCINANGGVVAKTEHLSGEFRNVLNRLSNQTAEFKARLAFNESVMKQKKMEDFKHGRTFEGWPRANDEDGVHVSGDKGKDSNGDSSSGSKRSSSDSNNGIGTSSGATPSLAEHTLRNLRGESNMMIISRQELDHDRDHCDLEKTVARLREVRDRTIARLNVLLESREAGSSALNGAQLSRDRICNLLTYHGDLAGDEASSMDTSFDHSLCHDCRAVADITEDCARHYERVSKQTIEVSGRLSMVVEIRERVKDIWESQIEKQRQKAVTSVDKEGDMASDLSRLAADWRNGPDMDSSLEQA